MAKANIVDYVTKMMIPAEFPGQDKANLPDQLFTRIMRDVYVPSERILVRTHNVTPGMGQILCGPPYLMYKVFIGDGAQNLHEELIAELGGKAKIREVDVTQGFIKWALALYQAQNADNETLDLLSP